MTSVPKKYRDRIESAEAPAVATPQATAVEPSSSAAAAKPAEQPAVETKSPVGDAALRKRLEETLGYRPKSNGNDAAQQRVVQPTAQPAQPTYRPTQAAPVRQQQYAAPVSAPPTRETLSMATGRPRNSRVPLTEDERQIARNSGISDDEYERQKDRMIAMKVAGYIDGR